ncbi:ribosomal protein S5 domain 2-like protein [Linderina pennispora]|uniref:Ribosomal protein S5 domain 2-like protein n=1 Tax=Linderina pennispora TaxID=61395 RepID=A0A1Y1WKH6_9FUNG|nr:ribosomal protein S5 domain 2-like protein [Linderina pennispora]ORX73706.1 ribosomal protein S5 domain 2-like protein [Linderina pennispora]
MAANIQDRKAVEPLSVAEPVEPFANGRLDGRALDQVRPIFMKTGSLDSQTSTQASPSGSAYYEQGKIRISCAVYGPRQGRKSNAKMGIFSCDFKYTPFSCSWRKSHIKSSDEKEIALILEQAVAPAIRLELYPKACVDAFITVIESDGKAATIAAAINCISAALVDAGIELGSSDCTQIEEDTPDEVAYILQHGKTKLEQTEEGFQACVNACTKVYAVICRYLQGSV